MICRLCLNELNPESSFTLFDNEGNNIEAQLLKIITQYLELDITSKDAISKTICEDCGNHLYEFHKFYAFIKDKQLILSQRVQASTADSVKNGLPDDIDLQDILIKCEPEDEKLRYNDTTLHLTIDTPIKCESDETITTEMGVNLSVPNNQPYCINISQSSRTVEGCGKRMKVIVKDFPRKRLRSSQKNKLRKLMSSGVPYNSALRCVVEEPPANEKPEDPEECKN